MQRPKRVLCIMDLSGAGRSSMAVVLPVLAACGVQGCALPTMLFSTHLGGFGQVPSLNTAPFCEQALAHYKREGVAFDAVYAGFLMGDAQFALAKRAMALWPDALKIVDPSLGDGGKLYSKITPGEVASMWQLCQMANLITPNYTESALLTGTPPTTGAPTEEEMHRRFFALCEGRRQVLITSVPRKDGGMQICGGGPGKNQWYNILSHHVPQSYPGTGDLFAAAVTGLVLGGATAKQAAVRAAAFDEAAVRATYQAGGEVRQGVWYEPHLHMLRGG